MAFAGRVLNRRLFYISSLKLYYRRNHDTAAAVKYTEVPEYPPCIDVSKKAQRRRKKAEWHEQVTKLPTVEQKLIELNMPKYWGYYSCQIDDDLLPVYSDDFIQYATRTHIEENGLPRSYYGDVQDIASAAVPFVKGRIEELIKFHLTTRVRTSVEEDFRRRHEIGNFLLGLNHILMPQLQEKAPHLISAMVDVCPRIESFWFLGGIPPDNMRRKSFEGNPLTKDRVDEPMDRPMQSKSHPYLSIRVHDGLPEVVSMNNSLATDGKVPSSILDPRAYKFCYKHKHATIIPGFWPGETNDCSQVTFHPRLCPSERLTGVGEEDLVPFFKLKAATAAFTQALSFAAYQGFGPVTELTYPMVHQLAITDGQVWDLALFQMNTCCLHSEYATSNPHNNILWVEMNGQLFDTVENGAVTRLNESLLAKIIAMYLKKGVQRENPSPYLGPNKYLWEHPACEDYRERFRADLHHVLSGRPRHRPKPEIYLWEKIYKIDNKAARAREPPRRWFEKHWNSSHPGMRRLDEHAAVYIPKACRKDPKVQFLPRIHSEKLYKYDEWVLKRCRMRDTWE